MVPMVSKRGSFEAKIGMDHEECLAVLKCLRKGRESLVQEERLLVDGVMGSIKEELLGHLDDLREQVENLARVKESD